MTDKRTYYHLFSAHCLALLSTGVATVALGLLAYRIAGADAGAVLGTALAIKMAAYAFIAPIAAPLVAGLPRRTLLIFLDLVRAVIAFAIAYVTEVWHVYLLIFMFQMASAIFTPTYQATVPDLLPREEDYTKSLTRSRLAYDLENLASPVFAAILLLMVSFQGLFITTVIGFIVSAAIIFRITLPAARHHIRRGIFAWNSQGLRIFMATPRLRGLFWINCASAAATAMVVVNSVVIVQASLGLSERAVAVALIAFGAGSVLAAIGMARLRKNWADRSIMLFGAALMAIGHAIGIFVSGYTALLVLWFALGIACSLAQTPSGHIVRRSSNPDNRQPLYTMQFALSNACLLIFYPLAGWLSAETSPRTTFLVFAIITSIAVAAAAILWREKGTAAVS